MLVAGMRAGTARNRSGRPYKPSVTESYLSSLAEHVYPHMGARKLVAVDRRMVQTLVDELAATRSASTVRNVLMPLRVIYRRALRDGEVAASPLVGVDWPAPDERPRDRMATPAEAQLLVAAVPALDRAAWALAVYAGLRLGELRALDSVRRRPRRRRTPRPRGLLQPDKAGHSAEDESGAAQTVPIVGELRRALLEHRLLTGRRSGLVVQREGGGVESGTASRGRGKGVEAGGPRTVDDARGAAYLRVADDPRAGCRLRRCRGSWGTRRLPLPSTATAICTRPSARRPSRRRRTVRGFGGATTDLETDVIGFVERLTAACAT